MNQRKWIATILIFIMVVVAIVFTTMNSEFSVTEGASEGERAPDFALENLAGETVRLSDYAGKKVFLNFWASWCAPCRDEMPDLQAFAETNSDVVVLGINVDSENDIAGFVKEYGLTYPNVLDKDLTVQNQYQVQAYPTSFFLDEDLLIRKVHKGVITAAEMESIFANF